MLYQSFKLGSLVCLPWKTALDILILYEIKQQSTWMRNIQLYQLTTWSTFSRHNQSKYCGFRFSGQVVSTVAHRSHLGADNDTNIMVGTCKIRLTHMVWSLKPSLYSRINQLPTEQRLFWHLEKYLIAKWPSIFEYTQEKIIIYQPKTNNGQTVFMMPVEWGPVFLKAPKSPKLNSMNHYERW